MAEDFKRRFYVSLVVTAPIPVLSSTVQGWFGFDVPRFPGHEAVIFVPAVVVALYGGWPFYRSALLMTAGSVVVVLNALQPRSRSLSAHGEEDEGN
jgi:cation transport ATPase